MHLLCASSFCEPALQINLNVVESLIELQRAGPHSSPILIAKKEKATMGESQDNFTIVDIKFNGAQNETLSKSRMAVWETLSDWY